MIFLKTLLFTIFVPGSAIVGIPYLLLSLGPELVPVKIGLFRLLGIPAIALGAAAYLRCAWDFAWAGQGTPAPLDPPKVLVARGLYGVVRNPMYLAIEAILIGEALAFVSLTLLAYAALLGLSFHLFVVYYEEPTLKKKFGAAYGEYRRMVPGWVPRVGGSKSPH